MSYSQDLLQQARHLARKESKKPVQASLRRAISSAYYAAFHFLNEESAKMLFGVGSKDREFVNLARRAIAHSRLKDVCAEFTRPTPRKDCLKPFWNREVGFDPYEIAGDVDLRTIKLVFALLQDKRHKADYDFAISFNRQQAIDVADQAEQLIEAWENFKNTKPQAAKLFAMAVVLWSGLGGR